MFDDQLRQVKEAVFGPIAVWPVVRRLDPIVFTAVSLLFGLLAAVALWQQMIWVGFLCWLLNRFFDGLDGTLARHLGVQSDLGGYVDILADFTTYALVPVGIVAGRPTEAGWLLLALLLSSFYVNAASWMYLAAILEKRQRQPGGKKTTIVMPEGLIGGGETIVFFSAFILFPSFYPVLFGVMALLVAVTVGQRLLWAFRRLPS